MPGADVRPRAAPSVPATVPVSDDSAPDYRLITIPAGTLLAIDLRTTVASDRSHVEDRVSAALRGR